MRRACCLVSFILALSVARTARPQGQPLGPEFRVNTYTSGGQLIPAVAADPSGNFVVVWSSGGQDGSFSGVFGQRYAGSGVPLGPEFRVNSYTPGYQNQAAVAADSAGNFVVVWRSGGVYPAPGDIFGQRFSSDTTPLGPEFQVNANVPSDQPSPAIAADPAGNFVVVWASQGQDGSYLGVFGQRFASSGVPLGPEFLVNTFTTGYQWFPSVSRDSAGNFVVAWTNGGNFYGPPVPADAFGQRYASDGTPLGPEFRINTYTTSHQANPAIAVAPAGGFVVVWSGQGQDDDGGIFAQRFAGSGAPLGPEFRVNTSTASGQGQPSVAVDSAGHFVIAWASVAVPADVFGQRYASDGTPLGPEFRINTFTPLQQKDTAVAADPAGNFVVVWDGYGQDGSFTGVFGQRYAPILPVELMHFRVE